MCPLANGESHSSSSAPPVRGPPATQAFWALELMWARGVTRCPPLPPQLFLKDAPTASRHPRICADPCPPGRSLLWGIHIRRVPVWGGPGEAGRPGAGLAMRGRTGQCSAGRRPRARTPRPAGPAPKAKTLSLLFLNLALALSQSIALSLFFFFFFLQKEGRGGKKMLHCAARPVSERRGANQRWPFRKLPFMARAAAAAPYKTRRRDAQPQPRPRPLRQHRPLALAAPPSPPVYTATR